MLVSRVERHILISKELDEVCFLSKNLYNKANYCLRQSFINIGKLPKEYDMTAKLSKRDNIDYKALPSQCSQQIIKLLYKNWKSFFSAIKEFRKAPNKFNGRPKLPRYKDKQGKNIVVFTNQSCRVKNGYIYFAKDIIKPIKTNIKQEQLQQVRIVPQATCYVVEVVYKKEVKANENLNKESILSIDLGLDNLATTINNVDEQPFIINGKPIKAVNQFYNKHKAKLMSFIGDKGTSNRIKKLTLKRNNIIQNYLHHSSRYIIDYCEQHNIGKIVIGNNKDWKSGINIGKQNNQNFVSIPFQTLIQQIQYKAEEVGIEIILTEESYTSKIDHLANEPMQKQENYLGRRIKRGLFKSSIGKVINADVNGAIGIIRKVIDEFDINQIINSGLAFSPIKITFNKDF